MRRIVHKGREVAYQFSGKGPMALMFLHGAFMDMTCWERQVEHFAGRYTVLAMDFPGHGRSGKAGPWGLRDFAGDVLEVLGKEGIEAVVLVGHSMAADVQLVAATQAPGRVKGWIAVDALKGGAAPLPAPLQAQVDGLLAGMAEDFPGTIGAFAGMALVTPATPESVRERVLRSFREASPAMGLQVMREVFSASSLEQELLPQLQVPAYLVNVDYAPTDEESLRKYVKKGVHLVRMEGTCHYPMLENPALLNEKIQICLDEIVKN
eukprot:TRINITY_DN4105_c0_g1_i1.p1 TRINITY_DN4105_c0_g1~~TRINITY_DN4105_c0_g1_i1.p1  ORF type:complete len:265 (-),score=43.26 TRINITY_DN4105_c0_g1_i1:101-895(-)